MGFPDGRLRGFGALNRLTPQRIPDAIKAAQKTLGRTPIVRLLVRTALPEPKVVEVRSKGPHVAHFRSPANPDDGMQEPVEVSAARLCLRLAVGRHALVSRILRFIPRSHRRYLQTALNATVTRPPRTTEGLAQVGLGNNEWSLRRGSQPASAVPASMASSVAWSGPMKGSASGTRASESANRSSIEPGAGGRWLLHTIVGSMARS